MLIQITDELIIMTLYELDVIQKQQILNHYLFNFLSYELAYLLSS